jgi:hypothetical protein
MNTMTSPASLLVKLSGVNSVIGPVVTIASKKLRTSSFPCRGPCQGAEVIAASVDQSMSPVTRSRMAWSAEHGTDRHKGHQSAVHPLAHRGRIALT